uniref:OB domain-containing protein n=1 Tax=Strongyloides papillosus TaxID=174720 RepID=A0A0N5BIU4_STREA
MLWTILIIELKIIHFLSSFISGTPFIPRQDFDVIQTITDDDIDEPYDTEEEEKDLEFVFTNGPKTRLTCFLNILILHKSTFSKRKDNKGHTFNILIADHEGKICECICFQCESSSSIYDKIEVGGYYTLNLKSADTFGPKEDSQKRFKSSNVGITLTLETTVFSPSERRFKFYGIDVNHDDISCIFETASDTQVNIIGIVRRINEIEAFISDSFNLAVPRRVIFLTNVLTSIPATNEIVENEKYLMHIYDVTRYLIKLTKFCTIAKIGSFRIFTRSHNPGKDTEPFAKVTLYYSLVSIDDVTLFANRITKLISIMISNFSQITGWAKSHITVAIKHFITFFRRYISMVLHAFCRRYAR